MRGGCPDLLAIKAARRYTKMYRLLKPQRFFMQYKTMVLELLKQRPVLYQQLCQSRTVLPALDRYALALKASHQLWISRLTTARPASVPSQITSEALELALEEFQAALPEPSPASDAPFSLDAAMEFVRRHTPSE